MKKASRSIIYKEKESIRLFLGEGKTLERDFINKLWECPFIGELKNGSDKILRLFNNACYICTRVFYDDYPPNNLKEYEEIAIDGHDDSVWKTHMVPVTMALVVNWLSSKECQIISEERGRMEDIEELCRRIRENYEDRSDLANEGKEEFQFLILHEHQLLSGFINDGSFQRISLLEAMKDPSVKQEDVFNSIEHLIDIIKNFPNEWLAAVGPDSHFLKDVQDNNFNTEEKQRELWEMLNKKYKGDKCSHSSCSYVYKDKERGVGMNIGDIVIAEKRKVDVIKILHAMCKIGLFRFKDGNKVNINVVMAYFGNILNEDFSQYSSNLSTSKSNTAKEESYLEIFDELRKEASKYFNKTKMIT